MRLLIVMPLSVWCAQFGMLTSSIMETVGVGLCKGMSGDGDMGHGMSSECSFSTSSWQVDENMDPLQFSISQA
jgi:hypothetical protein